MISVQEALQKIDESIVEGCSTRVSLLEARDRILATDLFSPITSPPFAQSAMDGYAIRYDDTLNAPLPIQGIVAAGETDSFELEVGKAARIFTGAPIPKNADTVVVQEIVEVESQAISWNKDKVVKGANVRPVGSQLTQGELAVPKGTRLTSGAIGFIASMGIVEVDVIRTPDIAILVTGDELVPAGQPLQHGQVYESNGTMLCAALSEAGITPVYIEQVRDDFETTKASIASALNSSDVLLISGGISVGDFDFVQEGLLQNEVQSVFYKVKQRPGKPFFFGKVNEKIVFALPGNPASVLSCYYRYVVPALRKMMGLPFEIPSIDATLTNETFHKKSGLTFFMKARHEGAYVEILAGQESYKLKAYTHSNALAELPEMTEILTKGERVKIYPLDTLWNS